MCVHAANVLGGVFLFPVEGPRRGIDRKVIGVVRYLLGGIYSELDSFILSAASSRLIHPGIAFCGQTSSDLRDLHFNVKFCMIHTPF